MNYRITTIVIFLLTAQFLPAQPGQRTVSGVVTSFEESLPLEGVKVSVKGTGKSSGTQADGVYYITINEEDSVLLFSLPGYKTQEIKITKAAEYNVVLHAGNDNAAMLSNHHSFCRRCRS